MVDPVSMGWDVFRQDENGHRWIRHHVIEASGHEDAARQVAESIGQPGTFYVCAASLAFEFTGEPVQAFRLTAVSNQETEPQ